MIIFINNLSNFIIKCDKILIKEINSYLLINVLMIKILFICHGNICRSPMAELIFKKKIKDLGLENSFQIDSMACSSEEIGNNIYLPAIKTLKSHNIPVYKHYAKRFEKYYYDDYDYIIAMDNSNIERLKFICPDILNKYRLLSSFSRKKTEISDPWYTRDFETCYEEIDKYLDGLLNYLKRYKKINLS